MSRPIRLVAALVIAASLLVAGRLVAQQTPVFRAGVDLVSVDVVVTDAHDQPINDLTAADFTLTESGRPQSIATFQHLSIPVAHRALDPHQPALPSPDVATNAPSEANSRVWVLIIDDQHIIEHDILHVKQVIGDFLRALPPEDQIAIVFVSRSDLSVNFTNDTAKLLKTIDHVRGAFGFGLDASGVDPTGIRLKHEPLAHARIALFALTNAISALEGSAHVRRAIVYVSGFSVIPPPAAGCGDCIALQVELDDAYAEARRADVPIYTLDPRGVPTPPTAVRKLVPAYSPGILANIRVQEDHLKEIADQTGGRAFVHQDDLTKAVHDLVADNGSFYVLGYSPTPAVHDGRFHEIHVTVNRPGAKVRARAGYVATTATAAPLDAQQTLTQALGRGVDVSGLALRAFAAPVAATAKGGMSTVVTVDVTYPPSETLPPALVDDLTTQVLALDPDAKIKASVTHNWHVTGRPAPDHTLTVRLDDVLELPAQPVTLRIGVASLVAGRSGTIQLPLDVPNPTHGKIQVGAVVIGLVTANPGLVAGFDAVRPLLPFQPTTTRTFTMADTVRVFAPIYWSTKDGTAEVTVAVSGDHASSPGHVTVTAGPGPSGRSAATVDVTLPLKDLGPGPCTIGVTAHLPSGAEAGRTIPCAIEIPK